MQGKRERKRDEVGSYSILEKKRRKQVLRKWSG
jgi:hypothetical protein